MESFDKMIRRVGNQAEREYLENKIPRQGGGVRRRKKSTRRKQRGKDLVNTAKMLFHGAQGNHAKAL